MFSRFRSPRLSGFWAGHTYVFRMRAAEQTWILGRPVEVSGWGSHLGVTPAQPCVC